MLKILTNHYRIAPMIIFLGLFCLSFAARAQKAEIQQSLPVEEQKKEGVPKREPGPKLMELEEYTVSLLKGLEPAQARYIYAIRTEFGIIRSIQVVKTDIENAVNSCGRDNPDMKETMENRFSAWKDTILPPLAVTDVALKDAIQRQTFRPTVRVSMLLDHVQAAFEERDRGVKKIPVTTAEACQKLLASLDNTEAELKKLLEQTTTTLNDLENISAKEPEKPTDAVQQEEQKFKE